MKCESAASGLSIETLPSCTRKWELASGKGRAELLVDRDVSFIHEERQTGGARSAGKHAEQVSCQPT
jgi:hypothetical protein